MLLMVSEISDWVITFVMPEKASSETWLSGWYSSAQESLLVLMFLLRVHFFALQLMACLTSVGSSMKSPSYMMLVVSILERRLFSAEESIAPLFSK